MLLSRMELIKLAVSILGNGIWIEFVVIVVVNSRVMFGIKMFISVSDLVKEIMVIVIRIRF